MFYLKTPRKEDIPAILQIEKACHENPWDEKAFDVELSKFRSGASLFYTAFTKENDKLAGYCMGDIIVKDYIAILNISVHPDFRRKGIARALLEKTAWEAGKLGIREMTLEVNANNTGAVDLYKKAGFEERGRRKKFYSNRDDAVLMWKKL